MILVIVVVCDFVDVYILVVVFILVAIYILLLYTS